MTVTSNGDGTITADMEGWTGSLTCHPDASAGDDAYDWGCDPYMQTENIPGAATLTFLYTVLGQFPAGGSMDIHVIVALDCQGPQCGQIAPNAPCGTAHDGVATLQ